MILKQGNGQVLNNNGELLAKRVHVLMSGNDGGGQSSADHHSMSVGSPDATGNSNINNGAAELMNSLQNHQQQQSQMCHIQQQANGVTNGTGNGGAGAGNATAGGGNATGNHLNEFQQMLQENSNYNNEKLNGGNQGGVGGGVTGRVMTPPQMDKPLLVSPYTTDDTRFQYVLAAATSIATKNNEDTLTYLNQGQSYEIKLKKLGDLTSYRNKVLTVRILGRLERERHI